MKFYVTTPIYYVNDIPHIGHAYTTVAADILARYNRMKGNDVFFLTGTDEHGQKVEQAAKACCRETKEHSDLLVQNFQTLWKKLNISNDAFIRTTDAEHKRIVQELLQKLYDKGEIEKRTYAGWYCTPDERFWTEKDVPNGKCPDCGREVERIEEENYFFKMSKYHDALVKHIEENPSYILPETRRNEVLGFLRSQTLGDLCISRPISRLSCGIPLPFDEDFVTYVWFDALVNYYSATKYLDSDQKDFWPSSHHIIGKDILTTHAVYWSAMLMALGLPLPKNIFAHGWWTIEGHKMSKSVGNVVDPAMLSDKYGVDAVRYFLFREVSFGHDGDYSEHALVSRINTDLANDFGNLATRTLTMLKNYFSGVVPKPESEEIEMKAIAEGIPSALDDRLLELKFQSAIEAIWHLVSYANKYIDINAPWVLAKDESKRGELATVIYSCAESLRILAVCLHPFMPEKTQELWEQLGQEGKLSEKNFHEEAQWGRLKPGSVIEEIKPLFPRIMPDKEVKPETKKTGKDKHIKMEETPKTEAVPAVAEVKTEEPKTEVKDNLIAIGDFMKVELKIGKIIEAVKVEKSNKLLKLQIDTGEMRQVVAGIAKYYAPEDLVGKMVVVVTNLQPAKLMGVESNGMLLAATDDEGTLSVLTTERPVKQGAKIK